MKDLKKVLTYIFAALLVITVIGLTVSLIRNAVSKDEDETIIGYIDDIKDDEIKVVEVVHEYEMIDSVGYDERTGELIITYSDGCQSLVDISSYVNGVVDDIIAKSEAAEHEHAGYDEKMYEVQAGDCVTDGIYIYRCLTCGELYLISYDPSNYSHNFTSTCDWAEDYSSATVTYSCLLCGISGTDEATITSETVAATCDTDGYITYKAHFEYEGAGYLVSTRTVTIEATGHTWDDGVEDEDGNIVYTCTVCGETKTEAADDVAVETSSTEVITIDGSGNIDGSGSEVGIIYPEGTLGDEADDTETKTEPTIEEEVTENVGTGGTEGVGGEEGVGSEVYL